MIFLMSIDGTILSALVLLQITDGFELRGDLSLLI